MKEICLYESGFLTLDCFEDAFLKVDDFNTDVELVYLTREFDNGETHLYSRSIYALRVVVNGYNNDIECITIKVNENDII